MKNRKDRMKTYQLVISILICLILIGLVVNGYYKQNQVVDVYAKQIEAQNKVEQELVQNGVEVDLYSDEFKNLFPMKYELNSDLLYLDLINIAYDNVTKKDILVFTAKTVEQEEQSKNTNSNTTNTTNIANTTENSNTVNNDVTNTTNSVNTKIEYETLILGLSPTLLKKNDKLELEFKAVYLKNMGVQELEGEADTAYICYKQYNFQTKSYVGRLTDNFASKNMNEILAALDQTVLNKIVITEDKIKKEEPKKTEEKAENKLLEENKPEEANQLNNSNAGLEEIKENE